MKLDTDDHKAIAAEVVALMRETPLTNSDVLTASEAMAYAKRSSPAAFCRWCQAAGVKAYRRGRYSRAQLDLALSRESRKRAA